MTILADRGFGDHKLFAFLKSPGFGYVIRLRGNIRVADAGGETRPAVDWVGKAGRVRKLRDARVTASDGYPVGAVVCVHAKAMKEPWCRVASDAEAPTAMIVNHYAKRWTIEPGFRDTKDLRATVVARWNAEGPAGLGDRRRGNGAAPVLDAAGLAALAAALDAGPADGGLWSGRKVVAWMSVYPGRAVDPVPPAVFRTPD